MKPGLSACPWALPSWQGVSGLPGMALAREESFGESREVRSQTHVDAFLPVFRQSAASGGPWFCAWTYIPSCRHPQCNEETKPEPDLDAFPTNWEKNGLAFSGAIRAQ